jgi:hypothetical protein
MMGKTVTASRLACWQVVLLLTTLWVWPWSAVAQNAGPQWRAGETQPTQLQRRGRGPGGRRDIDGLVRRLFRATPEDQGPLQPGEAEQLLAFAEQHAPRVYRLLTELRERAPESFQEKMAAHAACLRHLRRIYEHSPRMGGIVQAYANNLVEIERAARELRGVKPSGPDYERDMQTLRELVAQNVGRESDALDLMADECETQRAERVERRVEYLTGDEVDLEAEPERLRELITAFHAANADAERAALREKIQAAAARQVTGEIEALRKRAARTRENAAEEVNRRVEQLLQAPGGQGRGRGGPAARGGD